MIETKAPVVKNHWEVIDILKKENSKVDFNTLSDKITKQWQHLVELSNGLIKDYRSTNSFVSVFKNEKIFLF